MATVRIHDCELHVYGVNKNTLRDLAELFIVEDRLYGLVPWLPCYPKCKCDVVALAFEHFMRERGFHGVIVKPATR